MKYFVRAVLPIALSFSLAGCLTPQQIWDGIGTVSGTSVPGYTVVAAAQAFDASQLVAATYLNLPTCSTPQGSSACHLRSATPILKGAFQSGRIARNALKIQVRQVCATYFAAGQPCTAGIPVASYNTLIAATKTIDDATAAYRAATGK